MKKVVPKNAVLIPAEAKCVFEGKIHDVYQWQQKLFDGSEATFEMLKRPDTVTAICVVDDKILLLEDDQPHRGLRLGFPGGRVDQDDDSILAATRREVLEETGYEFVNWKLLRVWQPALKIEWFIYQFVAWDVANLTKPRHDSGERIAVQGYGLEEFDGEVLKAIEDNHDVFKPTGTIQELIALPEFTGIEADR